MHSFQYTLFSFKLHSEKEVWKKKERLIFEHYISIFFPVIFVILVIAENIKFQTDKSKEEKKKCWLKNSLFAFVCVVGAAGVAFIQRVLAIRK